MLYKNSEVRRMGHLLELTDEIIALKNKTDPVSKRIMIDKLIELDERLTALNDPDLENLKNTIHEIRRNLE